MSDIEEFLLEDVSHQTSGDESKPASYAQDLYKKWFRSKAQNGFLSIKPWMDAFKLKIDIGKTTPDGKLLSSTNVFVDAVDFGAYLRAITMGTAERMFPQNDRTGVPTAEGFVSYGGATIEGKPVSRIFKAHYWQNGDNVDTTAFAWKCGHFAARKSDSGAFIPDMKSPLSVDLIKVTRQDVCSISYLIDLAMISHVAQAKDWYNA